MSTRSELFTRTELRNCASGWIPKSGLLRRWLRSTGHKARFTGFGNETPLSRLLRQATTDNNGMSHHGYSDSTIAPPRFPLSGGSGFEEPVRTILRQSLEADVKEKLSKGVPVGHDPLPQLTAVVGIPLHVEGAAIGEAERMH